MKNQNKKSRMMLTALIASGLSLAIVPIASSSSKKFTMVKVDERLRIAKPIAGRNRRRLKSPVILPTYPRANGDRVRVSRHTDKLRINVLSNDNGHKLRVVNINPRSAVGAKVSMRNGMAVYQIPSHFVGKDSFWYTMQDRAGRQHSAKVIVCVCDK